MGEIIDDELRKKLESIHSFKWYMHEPESVLENETQKILWDYEIQTDHLMPGKGLHLVMIKKRQKLPLSEFYGPTTPQSKKKRKENEKRDKYLDLACELKSCKI